jgi:hypothetical protein
MSLIFFWELARFLLLGMAVETYGLASELKLGFIDHKMLVHKLVAYFSFALKAPYFFANLSFQFVFFPLLFFFW